MHATVRVCVVVPTRMRATVRIRAFNAIYVCLCAVVATRNAHSLVCACVRPLATLSSYSLPLRACHATMQEPSGCNWSPNTHVWCPGNGKLQPALTLLEWPGPLTPVGGGKTCHSPAQSVRGGGSQKTMRPTMCARKGWLGDESPHPYESPAVCLYLVTQAAAKPQLV